MPIHFGICPEAAPLGISCMYRKDYKHPHDEVLTAFTNASRDYFRTDEQYHLTVSLDGVNPPNIQGSRRSCPYRKLRTPPEGAFAARFFHSTFSADFASIRGDGEIWTPGSAADSGGFLYQG